MNLKMQQVLGLMRRWVPLPLRKKMLSIWRWKPVRTSVLSIGIIRTRWHALGQFDIILSNPPYIPHAHIANLQSEVREYDPIAALDGGNDGLEPYRHISEQLKYLLKPNGIILFEIGYDQAIAVQDILRTNNLNPSTAYKDLGGNDRIIVANFA